MKAQTFLFCLGAIIASVDAFAKPTSFSLIESRSVGGAMASSVVHSASSCTTTKLNAGAKGGIELAGLLYDSTSTAFDAWEWTANLGAPAALVAGAVLVTLSETRETMQPRRSDKRWVRLAKQWFRFLIVSAEECLSV